MRPIRLTMTAFGPYKDTEIVNFRELDDLQLFVISGATGAGKTTIFDAICFALYGNASGSDRENVTMLRSHFADDEKHTKVEFIFEIKERMYRVLRQIGHVKSGNKSKTGEKYELYEQTGMEEIPCVDRQIVTEINEKIEQLIGLTEDQFKQIVMLPQGEFRKLLTSETENKEEILRRLFNTAKYNDINEYLKEKKDHLTATYEQQRLQLEQTIHSIHGSLRPFEGSEVFQILDREYYEPSQVLEGLQVDLKYFEKKITTDERQYQQSINAYEDEQTRYHEGLALNKRFRELKDKKTELVHMEEKKETIKEKEYYLKQAEEARQLKPYETKLIAAKADLREKTEAASRQTQDLKKAEALFKEAEQNYETEQKQESTREQLKIDLQKYKDMVPAVEENLEDQQQLQSMEQHLEKQQRYLEQAADQKKQQHTHILQLKEAIKEQELKATKVHELEFNLEQVKRNYKRLNQYREFLNEKSQLDKNTAKEKQVYDDVFEQYKQLENRWLNTHAVLLADSLVEDEACPVCGSTHHPKPAVAEEGEVTKEALEIKRHEAETAKRKYDRLTNDIDVVSSRIKDKAEEIVEAGLEPNTDTLSTDINKLVEHGQEIRSAYNEAKTSHDRLTDNKKKLEDLETSLEELTKNVEKAEKAYYKEQASYTSLQARVTEKMRNIPKHLQDTNVLRTTLKQQEASLEEKLKAWEKAQQKLNEAKERKQTLAIGLEYTKKQLQDAEDKAAEEEKLFSKYLSSAGFADQAAYDQAKLTEEQREDLKQTIETYHKQYYTLTEIVSELEKELKNKTQADVVTMQTKLEKIKQQYEAALERWNTAKQERNTAIKLIDQIGSLSKKATEKEKEVGMVSDLHNVLRGQNHLKISFERYLQIDYLDNIIHSANERFEELMNGQFYLMRSDRKEAFGRQSGLAIDVFDGYTGLTRDVKTLSGGEKFIASLCLALGMSDVIQSFQGSISINTMFIDEGFGSLDEESLHKSIQALIQLQEGGRLIGVISHVEELKTIFPAILEVTKTKDGHSKTAFHIR